MEKRKFEFPVAHGKLKFSRPECACSTDDLASLSRLLTHSARKPLSGMSGETAAVVKTRP